MGTLSFTGLFVLQAFAVGSALYVWRRYVPWHWALAVAGDKLDLAKTPGPEFPTRWL